MIKARATIQNDGQIHQGDIYRDIDYIEYADIIDGQINISKIRYQYVMVISQECDLSQDYNERNNERQKHDKLLQSIMVIPMFNYEQFKMGSHFSNFGYAMLNIYQKKDSTASKNLMNNEVPRFHYIEMNDDISVIPSVMDFKRFFTADINYMYRKQKTNYVCSVEPIFRERISQRFANYLSRIGLPDGEQTI